jgi:hypothetical protein
VAVQLIFGKAMVSEAVRIMADVKANEPTSLLFTVVYQHREQFFPSLRDRRMIMP